jgi:antitoxin component of MazEF toxin-antitoxin module
MIKKLAAIGNSYGVIIDRPLLREAGISPDSKIEILVADGAIVVRVAPAGARRPRRAPARAATARPAAQVDTESTTALPV